MADKSYLKVLEDSQLLKKIRIDSKIVSLRYILSEGGLENRLFILSDKLRFALDDSQSLNNNDNRQLSDENIPPSPCSDEIFRFHSHKIIFNNLEADLLILKSLTQPA